MRRRHWNTLRECDRLEAIANDDEELAARVAFGTPYPAYRDRLRKDTGFVPRENFRWRLGQGGTRYTLDLAEGRWSHGGRPLKPGSTPHRFLVTLCSDFYRPIPVATVFQRLFAGEIYSPLTAPDRVHQAAKFLRGWLRTSRAPLDVVFEQDGYRLAASRAVQILVPWLSTVDGRVQWSLARLRKELGTRSFSAGEAASLLGVALRSAQKLLAEAVENGSLARTGSRRGTRYHFV